jgi:hypothetical protein
METTSNLGDKITVTKGSAGQFDPARWRVSQNELEFLAVSNCELCCISTAIRVAFAHEMAKHSGSDR